MYHKISVLHHGNVVGNSRANTQKFKFLQLFCVRANNLSFLSIFLAARRSFNPVYHDPTTGLATTTATPDVQPAASAPRAAVSAPRTAESPRAPAASAPRAAVSAPRTAASSFSAAADSALSRHRDQPPAYLDAMRCSTPVKPKPEDAVCFIIQNYQKYPSFLVVLFVFLIFLE